MIWTLLLHRLHRRHRRRRCKPRRRRRPHRPYPDSASDALVAIATTAPSAAQSILRPTCRWVSSAELDSFPSVWHLKISTQCYFYNNCLIKTNETMSVCLSVCLSVFPSVCFELFCSIIIFANFCTYLGYQYRYAFAFLVARHCALYCFVVIQFMLFCTAG